MKNATHLRTRALTEGALFVGLAFLLGYVKLWQMPSGGSLTPAMFPILLYALRFGLGRGLAAGFLYGLLQLLFDGAYAWGWQCMLLDYLLAFIPLGLCGIFKGKAWGIFPCVAIGSLGRFAVHYFSGVTLYKIIEPTGIEGLEGLGVFTNPHVYSIVYNGVYMLPNMLIAMVIAALLYVPMKKFFAGKDILVR